MEDGQQRLWMTAFQVFEGVFVMVAIGQSRQECTDFVPSDMRIGKRNSFDD